MNFERIDRETWARKDYFNHYFKSVPCTYSVCVKLDITRVRESKQRFYPVMLYAITRIVNRHPEFRTTFDVDGNLGIYDSMLPCYTVFHKETEQFSNLWTAWTDDFAAFCRAYEDNLAAYGQAPGMAPKPELPENNFPVSMIPWISFEGFNLNIQTGYDYLLPIFTMGKFYCENGRWLLPFSIQVHHAVCDGFHTSRFLRELQELLDQFDNGFKA